MLHSIVINCHLFAKENLIMDKIIIVLNLAWIHHINVKIQDFLKFHA